MKKKVNHTNALIIKLYCLYTLVFVLLMATGLYAQRVPVLNQITLPHNYYFRELYIPQLTNGPSSVCWTADGKAVIFSMAGSLWKQQTDTDTALQLTDGNGYDYQPDCSPDGSKVIFVRYDGASVQLMALDMQSGKTVALTNNGAVNLEPRWSPDGKNIAFVSTQNSGHFLLYKAAVDKNELKQIECLTPDRISSTKRYYYSAYDHAINPVWAKNGKEIFFVNNHKVAHGTGDVVCMNVDSINTFKTILHEETAWRTRPDISPDGSRIVYSSYLGRNWQQLWLLPTNGGYAMPLTYGDYDNTSPRWSPDGKSIAFISNRDGNTGLWLVGTYDGRQQKIVTNHFNYLQPHTSLTIHVQDENGNQIPARISITDSHEKFYAPGGAWIHGDDSRYPNARQYETHYFHNDGYCKVSVPKDKLTIIVAHGPLYEVVKTAIDTRQRNDSDITIIIKKIALPRGYENLKSGDVHVHMNYGGSYLNTPSNLIAQAKAEDLNFVYNLVVNKEQRIPDLQYFSTQSFTDSANKTILLTGQEFHTSYWGHLGLLNLNDHLIIPGYAGYPQTAVESLFPNNSFIADKAHEQNGLVGYAHPFDQSEIFPEQSPTLTNELPVDAALGKVDYYELIGFADHKASEAVWYKLLNCGLHLPAAAGTDAMCNYASLRGPVGLNRVYVNQDGVLNNDAFLKSIKTGKSFVTNGPIIGLKVENASAGDSILINPKGQTVSYAAFLRSNIAVDSFQIIFNGKVIATHQMTGTKTTADVQGSIKLKGPGWLLLRAWSPGANIDLPDIYPYASTNPIFIYDGKTKPISKSAAEYFLKWTARLEAATLASTTFRNEDEKNAVLNDIKNTRFFFNSCIKNATMQ